MIQHRSGQRKVRGSESCLKCDKKLRKNRADQSGLTQQTLAAALAHSLPPPYLLITTEEQDGGREWKLCGSDRMQSLIFFALCLVCKVSSPPMCPALGFNAQTHSRTHFLASSFLGCIYVRLRPAESGQIQVVDPYSHSQRDLERWTLFLVLVCVYIANWLESCAVIGRLLLSNRPVCLSGACFCFAFFSFWLEIVRINQGDEVEG